MITGKIIRSLGVALLMATPGLATRNEHLGPLFTLGQPASVSL